MRSANHTVHLEGCISMATSTSNSECDPTWELACHPIERFPTPEDAQRAINAFAREHGYAVVVQHTYYDKNRQRRRLVYACDRHGNKRASQARPGTKRRYNTATRRCGCPMIVNVTREREAGSWIVEHRGNETTHNHPPTLTPSSHPIHRRADRDAPAVKAIATDAEIGIRADQTLARLRAERPEMSITARDIYNERQRSVAATLGARSRIEHLVCLLRGPDYRSAVQLDGEGHLTHLFFAFKETLEIFAANHDVLVMDCTYKTNGFGMPLFNIIGVSGMNTTLHVAQVFMRGETEPDFLWALTELKKMLTELNIPSPKVFIVDRDLALLNALERVFHQVPVLLCIWHIIKDVEKHARMRTFPQESDPERSTPRAPKWRDSAEHRTFCDTFVALLYASSEEEFDSSRKQLHLLSGTEAAYIDDVWLDIWKQRIVRCWTNKVMHFGMQTTSRVEGYHSTLKTWITSSTGDLLTLHTRVVHWWKNSIHKCRTALSDAQVKTKSQLQRPLFAKVLRVIHDYALLLCLDNLDNIPGPPCTSEYSRVMGLPCAHKLQAIQREHGFLKPADFDAHWWIDRTQAPLSAVNVVLDPRRIADLRAERANARRAARRSQSRGRGARRILSGFEISQTRDSDSHGNAFVVSESAAMTTNDLAASSTRALPALDVVLSRGARVPKRLPSLRYHPCR